MKRRKRIKRRVRRWRATDPFDVRGKVRTGVSYQWVTFAVMGQDAPSYIEKMEAAGWRPVKPWRHPRMRKRGGRIVNHGQVLMERPEEITAAARQEETAAAQQMVDQSPCDPKRFQWGDENRWRGFQAGVVTPVFVSQDDVEAAAHKLAETNGHRYCRITIPMTVSSADIEMALYLKIDPAEYVRRRVVMDTEALVKRPLMTPDKESLFSRAEFHSKIL